MKKKIKFYNYEMINNVGECEEVISHRKITPAKAFKAGKLIKSETLRCEIREISFNAFMENSVVVGE